MKSRKVLKNGWETFETKLEFFEIKEIIMPLRSKMEVRLKYYD